ncbi:MAG: Mor transcription activator family protein [Mariprofundaceae bacterium]
MNNITSNQSISEFVSPEQLPGILNEAAKLMGTKAALTISDELGGSKVYLAKWTDEKSRRGQVVSQLAECIGEDATKQFCELFGSTHITIPSCKNLVRKMRDQAICADVKRGVKRDAIVRKYGISDRRIRGIVSSAAQQSGTGY